MEKIVIYNSTGWPVLSSRHVWSAEQALFLTEVIELLSDYSADVECD